MSHSQQFIVFFPNQESYKHLSLENLTDRTALSAHTITLGLAFKVKGKISEYWDNSLHLEYFRVKEIKSVFQERHEMSLVQTKTS